MENSLRFQETYNPSLIPSPKSHSTNSTSSSTSSSTNSNGLHHHHHHHHHNHNHHQAPPTPPPITPMPITRSEPNSPYPTTFVQADTTSFKQVVQMLTGSSETAKQAAVPARPEPLPVKNHCIPPIKTGPKKEKSKLYERRNSLKNFKLSPLAPGLVNKSGFSGGYSGSPRINTPDILSPSLLDFPSLALSPVTPLIPDPFNRSPHSGLNNSSGNLNLEAEDKAIAKKGFYLHPSPASTPRDAEPRLLPLFPVTSPRVSGSSGSD